MISGARLRLPELLRDTVFRRYWTGKTVSGLGDQISALAIPLVAVLAVHADAAAIVPDALRSRVFGAYRTVNFGMRPLGSLVAGGLASSIGLRPTLWVAVVGALASFLWLLPSPLPGLRELPGPARQHPGGVAGQHPGGAARQDPGGAARQDPGGAGGSADA
ncbi:hypothetical protein [Streptacidiphilus sp. PAMC 29251]